MSRVTSVGPESFHDVWGYCAVIGTRELMWSGYRIPAPDSVADLADYMAGISRGLSLETPRSRRVFADGAICWLANELVEVTYRTINEIARDTDDVDSVERMATALSQIAQQRFFIVRLGRDHDRQPLTASVEAIDVTSPEDARDYIMHHPLVLALEAEGIRRLRAREQMLALEPESALFTCERLHGPAN